MYAIVVKKMKMYKFLEKKNKWNPGVAPSPNFMPDALGNGKIEKNAHQRELVGWCCRLTEEGYIVMRGYFLLLKIYQIK